MRAIGVIGIGLMLEDLIDGEVSLAVRMAIGMFLALGLAEVLKPRAPR